MSIGEVLTNTIDIFIVIVDLFLISIITIINITSIKEIMDKGIHFVDLRIITNLLIGIIAFYTVWKY